MKLQKEQQESQTNSANTESLKEVVAIFERTAPLIDEKIAEKESEKRTQTRRFIVFVLLSLLGLVIAY